MAKPKRPRDFMQRAKMIVDIATGEVEDKDPDEDKDPNDIKNARLGGLKGGKNRAKKLSPERRKEIAQKAAKARWNK